MKNPNGYGSITKLSGNRRRPYMVRITTGTEFDFERKIGRQKQSVLGYYSTRKEALTALAEYNLNPYNLDKASTTIDDIWKMIKDKVDVSDERKKVYKSTYDRYITVIGNYKVKEVTAVLLQDLINSIPYGYSTQSIVRSVLNHIFNHAIMSGIIDRSYMEYVKLDSPKTQIERDLYTTDEIKEVWKHEGQLEYDFTLILLYQGMRLKELRDLRAKDIDMVNNSITIVQGKTEASRRVVPIHKDVRHIIERYMNNDLLLTGITKGTYEYFIKSVLHHKAYDSRHTFASKANELGIPKLTIQRLMGHKPDSVLEQAYIHLSMDELSTSLNTIKYF